jgi:hypothetical protein
MRRVNFYGTGGKKETYTLSTNGQAELLIIAIARA